jgi:hypothetical protein
MGFRRGDVVVEVGSMELAMGGMMGVFMLIRAFVNAGIREEIE